MPNNSFPVRRISPKSWAWAFSPGSFWASFPGALAKFIMPGKDPGGIFVTILIGIAGAIVGGFLGSFIGLGKVESFDLGGIFIATIGAIILLIVYRLLRKRT